VRTETVLLQTTTVDYPLTVWAQLRQAWSEPDQEAPLSVGLELLRRVPARAQAGAVHLLLREGELLDIRLEDPPFAPLGLAVDLGTTKIAAFLVDLITGEQLAADGIMNPQIPYGEDLMSRLAYALSGEKARAELSLVAAQGIDCLMAALLAAAGRAREEVYELVIGGNPAMHHLLLRLPVEQLGRAPYVPAISSPLLCPAADLGIQGAPQAQVHLLPAVAGFIGGDHLAMILGADLHLARKIVLGLDIGTNTEIVLVHEGQLLSCSCASGPAFEGAHIHQGMRAVEGAISRVRMDSGGMEIHYETIGKTRPRGFCGSGILDGVAELVRLGIVSGRGLLDKNHVRVRLFGQAGLAFNLVAGAESGAGREIVITQKDISEIQLAKGAVAAGIEILLQVGKVDLQQLDQIVVAGAFGTHLDIESAIRVGLLPDLPRERFRQVGNAAGVGAQTILLSASRRREVVALSRRLRCLELTRRREFSGVFARALRFPQAFAFRPANERPIS